MSNAKNNWILVTSSSLIIGSCIALSEIFITKAVDHFLPDSNKITSFIRPGSITILSTNKKIIQKLGPATREKVPEGFMPIVVKRAFIAAEDRRFYDHNGVDAWGIGRALLINIKNRKVKEGGSTITQQLARTVFLSQDRTFTRKIKEAALA